MGSEEGVVMKGLIFFGSFAGLFMIMMPIAIYGYNNPALVFGVLIPLCLVVAWIWTRLLFDNYFWR